MNRIVYLNGHFSDEKDAKISIFDRSFLFSDSVYEVTTVLDGKMIDFDNHMKRLDRSMSELKFPKMLNHDSIKKFHKDLIVKNLEPHRVPYYLYELSSLFHFYWNQE